MTLTEFLLARIAEDEATAVQTDEEHRWRDSRFDVFATGATWRRVVEVDELNGVSSIVAEHIARHDPARVLTECDAKRRILRLVESNWLLTESVGRLLALPYADHPDYDEAWRP